MLKKALVLLLVFSLFCSVCFAESDNSDIPSFKGMNDPALLQYTEDQVYSQLSFILDSEDYIIENVKAIYISQEYLDELAFNSQENLFFGYTLSELIEEFQKTGYIFTLGEAGTTIVKPFSDYDDTYDRIIRNIAIGTGVILVCVTVSAVTAGAGLATTSLIFSVAAKTGTSAALSGAAIGGAAASFIKGYETGDVQEALKSAALTGSESFKWGAIAGAITGGLEELRIIHNIAKDLDKATYYQKGSVEIPDEIAKWRKAELCALNEHGGYEQLSFLNGKQVDYGTTGATRPDIVNNLVDHIEAIEVKYYNLEDNGCLNTLYKELEREVTARVSNLPAGSTQKIILDVTDRGYPIETLERVASHIWDILKDIYPQIPIEFVGA